MPGCLAIGTVELLLQVPAATMQVVASAAFAMVIVFGVACLRQWRAARRWDRVLSAYAERDIAERRQSAKSDPPVAHVHKPAPPRADNSNGPSPL